MKRSVQLVLFLVLSYPVLSLSGSVSAFCGHTHYPALCMATSSRFSRALAVGANARPVLKMHLGAIGRRCGAAKNEAQRLMRRAGPVNAAALKDCADLYSNAVDLIGVSMRALNANDAQTRQMVQIMLQQIRQSAQQCDLQFMRRPKAPNPMAHFDGSIIKMTINCDDLNTMS